MTTQSLTAPLPIPQHRSSRTDKDSSSSHNSLSGSPSSSTSSQSNQSYRELVKQITSQAPKPYGAIPPLIGRHKRKKRKKEDSIAAPPTATDKNIPPSGEQPVKTVATRITGQDKPTSPRKATLPPMRSMSHVENWVAVDSKESLPDEEELEQRPSALRNFLSADFLTEVLPLHVPPPPLSDPESIKQQEEIARLADTLKQSRLTIPEPIASDDDDDAEESFLSKSDARRTLPLVLRKVRSMNDEDARWQDTKTASMAKLRRPRPDVPKRKSSMNHTLSRRHSLSSLTRKAPVSMHHKPPLYPLPPPPPPHPAATPHVANEEIESWFSRLKRSLSGRNRMVTSGRKKLIPMPPPPKRPTSQRRRSEATTQPRFNPVTNTYMRDTRSNSDHLRMITAELNMMRSRKLLSPLKPRGFLPRRRDAFVRGDISKRPSHLRQQVLVGELEDQLEEGEHIYEDEDTD